MSENMTESGRALFSTEVHQTPQKAAALKSIASLIAFQDISRAAKFTRETREKLGLSDEEIANAFAKGVGRVIATDFLPNPKKGLSQADWWIKQIEDRFYHEAGLPKRARDIKKMAIKEGLIHAILRLVEPMDPEGQLKTSICELLRVDVNDYPREALAPIPNSAGASETSLKGTNTAGEQAR
jgi:hypothetical protein